MKVKLGCSCIGLHESVTEIIEVEDEATDEELEEAAREHGHSTTNYEHWYVKLDENGNEVEDGNG